MTSVSVDVTLFEQYNALNICLLVTVSLDIIQIVHLNVT